MKPSAMTSFVFNSLFIFLLFSACSCRAASAGTSLTLGSSLSLNQNIKSADGFFQFGFFSLNSSTTSSSIYLGVTYATLTPLTAVWIANRAKAVSQAAICTFAAVGFVNLTDNGEIVWSIGQAGLNASSLVLENTSNVVLRSSNLSKIWQSFDHPSDTWMPGMTFGWSQKLQSWLTATDPTPGFYSYMMGDRNNFIAVYNGSTQFTYWDSGPWDNSTQIFSDIPDMTENFIYSFNFSSSTGFTYYVKENESAFFKISKLVMKSNGQSTVSSYNPTHQNWNDFWFRPQHQCDVVRLCGQNSKCDNSIQHGCACLAQGFRPVNQLEWNQLSFSHGCERKSPLNCGKTVGSKDGFLAVNQTTFVSNVSVSMAIANLQQCKDWCLANCSCNGFFFNEEGAGNCSLFTDNLYDGTVSLIPLSGTFYLRVAAKDLLSRSSHKARTGKIIGAMSGAIAILVLLALVVMLMIRRTKLKAATKTPEAGLRAFSYAELQAATKNFKERLGSGGFGTVFRGVLGGGRVIGGGGNVCLEVAVKKLHTHDKGDKQFRVEVRTLGIIQHVNLIRLMGFCAEGAHRLLVYALAENGSLDHALFKDHAPAAILSWPVRFNIALGTARGLAYLHESCHECIIHCDVKPENILLDDSYNAKVADFGLAKLVGRQFSHVLTTLRGTRGYLAPEWIQGLSITAKADVYSYGMTILELLSGHRNISNNALNTTVTISHDGDFFPLWAAQLIHHPNADLTYLLDPRIKGEVNIEEVQQVVYCAIWCIQDNEDLRPSMGKVVQMLEGTLPISTPPIPTSLHWLIETDSDEPKPFLFST